ncbi:aminotransferase class I/II-fold pyridoxal phosphate-dependent enzyme [Pseudomonas sp. S1_A06]
MDDLTLIGRVAPFRDASAYAASSGALNLSQGIPEPLFDNAMNAALARQVRAGWQYADPRGEMILRESIAAHSAGYAPDSEVLVTSGCTEALYLALYAASTQYGSRVAFFEPFYPYYPGMASLLGLEFVAVPLSAGESIGLDWAVLEQQLRAGVRILLLNTPHNPTGWCMSADDWQHMVALAKNHDFMVIVDEAYRHYQYDTDTSARYPPAADSHDGGRQRIKVVVHDGRPDRLVVRAGNLHGASLCPSPLPELLPTHPHTGSRCCFAR